MEISVYGAAGCPQMALVTEFISAGGALVRQLDVENNPISPELLRRLLAFEGGFCPLASQDTLSENHEGSDCSTVSSGDRTTLRSLIQAGSAKLPVPLAVRGTRVIVASSPDRVQSLMY